MAGKSKLPLSIERQDDMKRQALAAAVAEFVAQLKMHEFPHVVEFQRDGESKAYVMMPVLVWRKFQGGLVEMVEHLRHEGLSATEELTPANGVNSESAGVGHGPTLRLV